MTDEERSEFAALRQSLEVVETELRRLRDRVATLESGGSTAARDASAEGGVPAASPTEAFASPPGTRRVRRPRLTIPEAHVAWFREFFSEGNPLNKLGALSLIVGAAVVFKYAIDSGWIGPTGRVGLGLLCGAALIAGGEVYARKGWQRFASGLVAAGDGLLFLAVYFGHQQYEVIPVALAFGLYVIVTAAVTAQALRYDAQALAVWGLLGGYLAPALASTGSGNFVFLSTYLLVLNGGVLAIAYSKTWQPLKWMSFLLTTLYAASWVYAYADDPGGTRWLELRWLLPYLAAFFVFFAAIPTWRSVRLAIPVDAFGQVLTVASGIAYFVFTAVALRDEHRAWLGLVAAVVAVLYALVSSRMVKQPAVDREGLRVFTGTAAGFLLLATPYLVNGPVITLVWCAQTLLLAWGCTRPNFAFLRLHVLAMLALIGVRLLRYDVLLLPAIEDGVRYVPFAQLESWPPFAAALTFALVARMAGRIPDMRFPTTWVGALAIFVMVAAVDGEAKRSAIFWIAPFGSHFLHELIRAGILIAVMCSLWFGVMGRAARSAAWTSGLGLALLLSFWALEPLLWWGGYPQMLRILGDGHGLWWLHAGALLMLPLALLFFRLAGEMPERTGRFSGEQLRVMLFAASLVVVMLVLRREIFAITHAPPLVDWFSDSARRASYRTLLSLAYASLAFFVYLSAVRTGVRTWLHAAYALYVFTAFKVYVFDLESQNQLYRAFSLLVFAAILFVSSHFASRQQRRRVAG